jgi:hypothetical protein
MHKITTSFSSKGLSTMHVDAEGLGEEFERRRYSANSRRRTTCCATAVAGNTPQTACISVAENVTVTPSRDLTVYHFETSKL